MSKVAASKGLWGLVNELLGCCSPCHPALGQELYSTKGNPAYQAGGEGHPLWGASPSHMPWPPSELSARSGPDCADWAPPSSAPQMAVLPQDLLVEPLESSRASSSRARVPDPSEKARERARLRDLVSEFVSEASRGRPCSIVALGGDGGSRAVRRDARYELRLAADSLVLHGRAPEGAGCGDGDGPRWEQIGCWSLRAVRGAHRAEDSELVRNSLGDLRPLLSNRELSMSAVLEFGGGACAARAPLLFVENSVEHRERFVSGMQILRLYKGATRRLEAALKEGGLSLPGSESNTPRGGSSVVSYTSPISGAAEAVGVKQR